MSTAERAADPRRWAGPRIDQAAVPSAGTRPLATAPTIIPKKNGVISDDAANITPNRRARAIVSANLRKANPAPRSTMPAPTSSHGMYSVVMIGPKPVGNAVHRNTST